MPLLWIRIASEGSPPKRYTLQGPFQLSPTHALTPTDVKEIAFGGKKLEIVDSARNPSTEDDEKRRALDRMRSRLAGLKEESISENLRNLAAALANVIGETTEEARHNMVSAYNIRSKLVHDGHATKDETTDAAAWLSKAVPAILESFINDVSKP
jgi:hypothetical protein